MKYGVSLPSSREKWGAEWAGWNGRHGHAETAVTCNRNCMLSPRTTRRVHELLLHSPADVQDGGLYSGHRLPSGGLGGWCTYVCLHVNSVLLVLRVCWYRRVSECTFHALALASCTFFGRWPRSRNWSSSSSPCNCGHMGPTVHADAPGR